MRIELPYEIWRHILSYNQLPICSRVCTLFDRIEKDLYQDRVDYIVNMYNGYMASAMAKRDWTSSMFIYQYREHISMFSISDVMCKHIVDVIDKGRTDIANTLLRNTSMKNVDLVFCTYANRRDIRTMEWMFKCNHMDKVGMSIVLDRTIERYNNRERRKIWSSKNIISRFFSKYLCIK